MKRKLDASNNVENSCKSTAQKDLISKNIFKDEPGDMNETDGTKVNKDDIYLKSRHARLEDARGSSTERYESSSGSKSSAGSEDSTVSAKSNAIRRRSFWIYCTSKSRFSSP